MLVLAEYLAVKSVSPRPLRMLSAISALKAVAFR